MGTKNKKSQKSNDSSKQQTDSILDTNTADSTIVDEEITAVTTEDVVVVAEHKKSYRKRKKHHSIAMDTSITGSKEPSVNIEHGEIPASTKEDSVVVIEVGHKKSYRKRKKHHFNAIRAQMEFYFGDSNLNKDRFLKQMIDKDPYVPLDVFLTFNKMKALTAGAEDIITSLSNSELLELDETQQKVKRKTSLPEKRNVDEKTLYVEALPPSADHEWVRQIFERFGKVEYVSLPRYAKSRKIKEFGFIEYEKEESVSKAINVFREFNGVLCMQEKDPSELSSVKSFIKEQAGEDSETTEALVDTRKRTKQESQDDSEPKAKKIKTESQDEEDSASNNEGTSSQPESEAKEEEEKQVEGMEEEQNKKKRRKRKKKSKSEEKLKRKAELKTDVSYYELKVLPKKDWKRLRNKYLNLQREKVAELKRKAWREREETRQQGKDVAKEESSSQIPDKDLQKKPKDSKHKLQKMNMNFYGAAAEEEAQAKNHTTEKTQHNPALERPPLFSFELGLIVEMTFLEPCVNVKEYKADMRQYPSVKYVDVKEGSMQSYLRLESADKATEFVKKISCAEYQCKILEGEAESTYWQKIEKDRELKLNKQVKVPQKRGREKVKKLITKHIRFGDDDE